MDHCVRQVEVQPKSLNRSREVSLVEHCTIDCECLANFLPKKVKKIKKILCNFLVRTRHITTSLVLREALTVVDDPYHYEYFDDMSRHWL